MPSDPSDTPPPKPPRPQTPDYRTPLPGHPKASPVDTAGMTLDQITAIKIADVRAKKIRRLAGVAMGDATTTAFFAFCCFCCVCLGWINLVLGIAFAIVAFIAFKNARAIRQFDTKAPKRLALNQLLLLAIITAYCIFQMLAALWSTAPVSPDLSDALAQYGVAPADIAPKIREYTMGFYALVILGSVLTQGLTAAYYLSRAHLIDDFLASTPQWVVDFRRTIPR
ncbi:MAG TPA: hypothetical protein VH253_09935 [Phycisphaerae bacterium]|nr:hypothetical protein [Phycisphaerae bacterium]